MAKSYIMYIKFCTCKSILNSVAVPFWGGSPPIQTFIGSYSEHLHRGPHCSTHWRNIPKSLHTIVVLRIGYNSRGRNNTSFQYLRCPIQQTKKRPFFAQLRVFFRCHFASWSLSPKAEIKYYVRFFENFLDGLRYGGVSAGLAGQNQRKWFVSRGRIWKLGGQHLPPPPQGFFSAFTRLNI